MLQFIHLYILIIFKSTTLKNCDYNRHNTLLVSFVHHEIIKNILSTKSTTIIRLYIPKLKVYTGNGTANIKSNIICIDNRITRHHWVTNSVYIEGEKQHRWNRSLRNVDWIYFPLRRYSTSRFNHGTWLVNKVWLIWHYVY